MKNSAHKPPAWMVKILGFYCNENLLEDLEGDLYEFYYRNVADKGKLKAQFIYFLDVLKFIRLYTVKTPKLLRQMNYLAIFKNSLKTSWRSILRNKLFSGINVIGLSVSMSVGLLVITMYMELNKFDKFHKQADRIYRITNTLDDDSDVTLFATSSVLVGQKIREEFTGVESVVTARGGFGFDAHYGDKVVPISGKYASPEFGDVFDFEVLEGNLVAALEEPNALVITRNTAEKLFGEKSALNEVINDGNGENYTIRAVLENFPKHSHIDVGTLCSFITIEQKYKDNRWFSSWRNMWMNYVYVLLEEGYELKSFQTQLDDLTDRENTSDEDSIHLGVVPLIDILPGEEMSNMGGPSFDRDILLLLAGLSIIILISACFNYTNLSIARSLRRSKEVGIRKTVGATKGQVFFQFVLEACVVSIAALVIAVTLFYVLRPYFIDALGYSGRILDLTLTLEMLSVFLFFAILTGVMAGFFPSYLMSRMQVKAILKDVSSIQLFSQISLRKALIVFQFSLSMIFIISTMIGFKQYNYMLHFDLGYSTDNILNVATQNNNYELLEAELRKVPQVTDISYSLMIPSVGSLYTEQVKDPITLDSAEIGYNKVHPNYLKLHEHELIAGSHFDESYINAKDKVGMIVNQQFLELFKIAAPEEAIGKKFVTGEATVSIIGVVKDFHFGTTEDDLGPFLFLNGTGDGTEKWPDYYQANLKLNTTDMVAAVSAIEKAWKNVDKVHQFKAKFYSEEIERTYSFFKSLINIIGFLAIIAISIATLGLLGMVVFTTETRLKEISIRKILGASEGNLLILLGKSFLLLLCLAALIAIPVTFYTFNQYILVDYIYRPEIGFFELFGGSMLILIIGLVIVFSQTILAARTNPATMLRND